MIQAVVVLIGSLHKVQSKHPLFLLFIAQGQIPTASP